MYMLTFQAKGIASWNVSVTVKKQNMHWKIGGTSESVFFFLSQVFKSPGINIRTNIFLGTTHNCVNCTCFYKITSEAWPKLLIFRMHSTVNKILKRQSYSRWRSRPPGWKFALYKYNYVRGRQASWSCFKFTPEVRYPITKPIRKAGLKILLFYDQSEKSPVSGLQADDRWNNCIRRSLILLPPAVKKNAR